MKHNTKRRLKDPTTISYAAENLLALVRERGQNLAKLSRLIGRNETYLQQFVTKGIPEDLCTSDRLKLCLLLNCSIEQITNDGEEALLFKSVKKALKVQPFDMIKSTGWIKKLGKVDAKTKKLDFRSPNGGIDGMATPTILIGVEDAYATVMPDEAMEPAIFSGATIFVNPIRPPVAGDHIVIRFKDGTGTIRNFLASFEQAGFIMVKQYNPAKEFSIPLSEIKAIHLIAAVTCTSEE